MFLSRFCLLFLSVIFPFCAVRRFELISDEAFMRVAVAFAAAVGVTLDCVWTNQVCSSQPPLFFFFNKEMPCSPRTHAHTDPFDHPFTPFHVVLFLNLPLYCVVCAVPGQFVLRYPAQQGALPLRIKSAMRTSIRHTHVFASKAAAAVFIGQDRLRTTNTAPSPPTPTTPPFALLC